VPEEYVASIFRKEEQAEEETSAKAGGKQSLTFNDDKALYPIR
jgi:hypothetical protein